MDLGGAKLKKTGLNNLHYAVHPRHGVIWTDGKGIYLAPIQVEGHQVQNAASVKVGEFENVTSVHWSSNNINTDFCHMCVVHQQNVTVWRVSGSLPKLVFKQVRKINVKPVPQGCLWNPHSDVLCLLSRHQCSFYFRHDMNKGNYAFPALESSSIVCGCWSPSGTKLIICVGAALLIYRWSDVNAPIENFSATAWRIPGLEGKLTSIAPVLKDSVVVAAEVPLESLCKQLDVFKVPDCLGAVHKKDDDVIRPNKTTSVTESLFNLQQNSQVVTECRSSLTMIRLSDGTQDPIKVSTVPLKGALSPDILIYEKSSQCVIVGSNCQSQLHIYALLEKHLAFCGNIQLDKDQRPKGLCSMPTVVDSHGAALLILVGQREGVEPVLISPSTEADFRLSMKYVILKAGYNHHLKHNGCKDDIKDKLSDHSKSSSLIESEATKPHHGKSLSDPHTQKLNDFENGDEQKSSLSGLSDTIKFSVPNTEESLLDSEDLLIKPQRRATLQKQKLIDDLSNDLPSQNKDLDVETVPFASQTPSFNNSKLAAEYTLDPVCTPTMNDHTNSLHSPMSNDKKLVKTAAGVEEKTDTILETNLHRETRPQLNKEKCQKSDHILEKDNIKSLKQTNCSLVNNNNVCNSQNSNSTFYLEHDNDQLIKIPQNNLLHIEQALLPNSELEAKHQTHNPSLINSVSQSNIHGPQSNIEPVIVPSQIKAKPHHDFSHLESEKISEITICPQNTTKPSNHCPSLPPEVEPGLVPTENKTHVVDYVSNSQSEITSEIMTTPISQSNTVLQNNCTSQQSDLEPIIEPVIVPSYIKTKLQNYFSNLLPEITPEVTATPLSQTSSYCTKNNSISPQPDIEPVIVPSQIKAKLPNYFSSLLFDTTPASDLPTETEINHYPDSQSELKYTTALNSSLQPNSFSGSQPTIVDKNKKPQLLSTRSHNEVHYNSYSVTSQSASPHKPSSSKGLKEISLNHLNSLKNDSKEINSVTKPVIEQSKVDYQEHFSLSSPFEINPSSRLSNVEADTKLQSHLHSLQSDPHILQSPAVITSLQFKSKNNLQSEPGTNNLQSEPSGTSHLHSKCVAFNNEDNSKVSGLSQTVPELSSDHVDNNFLSDNNFVTPHQNFDNIWEALEQQTKSQKESIEALHRRVELLSQTIERTACVLPTKYQDVSKPEMIEISYEKPNGNETKRFLLDNGRLQLEPVKLAFGLATVELWLDGVPCVLGANIDGYIPLKFSSSNKFHISGQPIHR